MGRYTSQTIASWIIRKGEQMMRFFDDDPMTLMKLGLFQNMGMP